MSSVEKLEGLKQRLTITVPEEEVEAAYQNHLKKTVKSVKLPGFQSPKKLIKPKAIEQRLKVVEQLYGKAILQEAINELVQSNLRKAIEQHQLQIAGTPQIELKEVLRGKPFQYIVNFEVYPGIELQSLEGETVTRLITEISDKDIDAMIESLRKQHAEWKESNDAVAEAGHRVIINFEGLIDGEPFERGSANDFELELGSQRMISGFEEGIVGMKVGDTKAVEAVFPEEYPIQELAGKTAVFNITLNKVKTPELPELNNAFVEKLGIKGGMEALRGEVKANMEKEINHLLEGQFKMTVLDKLLERNPIDVPTVLVEAEIDRLQKITRQQIEVQRGVDLEKLKKIKLPREPYQEQAKKRVLLGLLLAEVIKKHGIKINADKVRARIEDIAKSYQKAEEVVSWYYNNKELLSEVETVVLEDEAVEVLLTQLKVNEKELPYEEAVKQVQKG